ncbi:MAG TPA: response regulator transcription factor [Acidimicrobiales bacterium]|nr:response regulator transcription factor [Acidimicrobiales bacterium]
MTDLALRILVVDDEPYITDLLSAALKFEGFAVDVAGNGAEAVALAQECRHDLVLLDVMLPDVAGTEVCRRLRDSGISTPVLFLTARDATDDKVTGLTVGGDDYVTKPFSLDELLARIHAVLRRTGLSNGAAGQRLVFADLEMDEDTHEVWRQGLLLELTATEFNLLRYMLENARRVLSKSEILDHVWSYDFEGDRNIVETYVSYLRKKVDCFDPALIHTIRGVGYTLRLPRDQREQDR